MSESPFDVFSPFVFSAGEPSTAQLVSPNVSIPLLTLLDCLLSHVSIFAQLHNARLTVSDFTNELRPE
jgi:hypothetical protein